jgi:transcriptional regulator with XRE-family HTH domain
MDVRNPKDRTVPIDGDRVIDLRKKKGWTVADLASKAYCSVKTIESIESGKGCLPFMLNKVARAFKIEEPETLLVGAATLTGRRRVFVDLDEDYHSFDQTVQLSELIKQLIALAGMKGEVRVIDVTESSVRIELDLDEEDYSQLFVAYYEGKLKTLRIKRAISTFFSDVSIYNDDNAIFGVERLGPQDEAAARNAAEEPPDSAATTEEESDKKN